MAISFLPKVVTSALEDAGILKPEFETETPGESPPPSKPFPRLETYASTMPHAGIKLHQSFDASKITNQAVDVLKLVAVLPLFALSGFGLFQACVSASKDPLLDEIAASAPNKSPAPDPKNPEQKCVGNNPQSVTYCDIIQCENDALLSALHAYNTTQGDQRLCQSAIRFMHDAVVPLPTGLKITQKPNEDHAYGTAIRSYGPKDNDEGCSVTSSIGVVLDFSDYTKDNGNCPIQATPGAYVDFINLKVIAKNPEKAFCDTNGNPIPVEDPDATIWIHNVKIVGPGQD